MAPARACGIQFAKLSRILPAYFKQRCLHEDASRNKAMLLEGHDFSGHFYELHESTRAKRLDSLLFTRKYGMVMDGHWPFIDPKTWAFKQTARDDPGWLDARSGVYAPNHATRRLNGVSRRNQMKMFGSLMLKKQRFALVVYTYMCIFIYIYMFYEVWCLDLMIFCKCFSHW